MINIHKHIYSSFLLVVLPMSLAWSQPSDQVRYLMDEPVSIFEWGLFMLKDGIRTTVPNLSQMRENIFIGNIIVTTNYHWEQNRIAVRVIKQEPEIDELDELQTRCGEILRGLRAGMGIDPDTGQVYENRLNSHAIEYFTPRVFRRSDQPENLAGHLDSMLYFNVSVATVGEIAVCEGDLLSNTVHVL